MLDSAFVLTLPAGAYRALRLTRHDVLDRIDVTVKPASRGASVEIRAPRKDGPVIRTLLTQLGSGAWPGVTAYERKACRRALTR